MSIRAFSSDVVYTLNGNPIPNGVIEINEEGLITHIGENSSHASIEVTYKKGLICPGFVNTHCHLELSHLKGQVEEKRQLHHFIQDLQSIRSAEQSEITDAIKRADQEMRKKGIVAVGDISNSNDSFDLKAQSNIHYHSFIELFGFNPDKAQKVYDKGVELSKELEKEGLNYSIVPHSPYSMSDDLLSLIASTKNNRPLSIHNQETAGENEMYESKSGSMVEMLERFGNDLHPWQASQKSSLQSYLKKLPKQTPLLLVHNTYTTQADIQFAEQHHDQLYWCFCPNANLYIENRLPDLTAFVKEGVKCTLGTDSLASNWQLSIWEEIKSIQDHFPQIEMDLLLQWACKNGAEFLGLENELGTLEIGKKPGVVQVNQGKVFPLA